MNTKTENTEIKTVSLPNTSLTFKFVKAGIEKTYKLSDLPEASLIALLNYGTRKGNDFCNSAFAEEGNTKSRKELVEDWLKRLETGDFSPKRESDDGFKAYVKTCARKLGESDKSLKGLSLEEIIALIALRKGAPVDKVEETLHFQFERVKALFEITLITDI